MHITGKICAWVLVLLVAVAVFFTGKAINVRNSWTQKADQLAEANAQKKETIAKKEIQLKELLADRALLMRSWGRPWMANNVVVRDPQTGQITTDLGARNGLKIPGAENPPTIYGFYAPQNGPSRFIGPFQVVQLTDSNSTLQLTKYPRQEDISSWQQGAWRFWQFVPTQFSNRFENQWNELLQADERLAQAVSLEKEMVAQRKRSQEQIAEREAELTGGPELPQTGNLPSEDLEGLVKALGDAEQNRNTVLLTVDTLRKQIHAAQVKLQGLVDESRQLVEQLPQPTVDTASK
ncbi:MAG: hypothetical protein HUJ26_02365 [Planctomycetaceae bacterium]|nr:hypothetical protein [Planctomycetaceae bacterium]